MSNLHQLESCPMYLEVSPLQCVWISSFLYDKAQLVARKSAGYFMLRNKGLMLEKPRQANIYICIKSSYKLQMYTRKDSWGVFHTYIGWCLHFHAIIYMCILMLTSTNNFNSRALTDGIIYVYMRFHTTDVVWNLVWTQKILTCVFPHLQECGVWRDMKNAVFYFTLIWLGDVHVYICQE